MEFLREVTCSKCENLILRKSHDGFWRFSTKVLKSTEDGGGVVAVCRGCGNEELMPITISMAPMGDFDMESKPNASFSVRDKKKP